MRLVPPPHGGRNLWQQVEDVPQFLDVGREDHGAVDRVADIGDHAVGPPAYLVVEDARPPEEPAANRASADDAALLSSACSGYRRHLDNGAATCGLSDQRGVEQRAGGPPLDESDETLIDPARRTNDAGADAVTGAQRDPVQLESRADDPALVVGASCGPLA